MPFTLKYIPHTDDLLYELSCTIALTTYLANRLVFISAVGETSVVQSGKGLDRPMGVSFKGNKLAVATARHISVFEGEDRAGIFTYNLKSRLYTGEMDTHDVVFIKDTPVMVNTRLSCVSEPNAGPAYVKPIWKPEFISKIRTDDRCHLNSIAVHEDKIMYATAFSDTDIEKGWKHTEGKAGILIDCQANEIVARNLYVPHSVRYHEGNVYALLSATGELVRFNLADGSYDVITRFPGFVRGLAIYKGYFFIGLSERRETSSMLHNLPVSQDATNAGLAIVNIATGETEGMFKYINGGVGEVYDVQILDGIVNPVIL